MSDTWSGEERRKTERRSSADILAEFAAVRASLENVSAAVTRAFPEDRVREIIANEQRHGRARFIAWILGPVIAAFLFFYLEGQENAETVKEAKVAADFVRDCVQNPQRLTPEQRVARCGEQGSGTGRAVQALIEFQKCQDRLLATDTWSEQASEGCVAAATRTLRGG